MENRYLFMFDLGNVVLQNIEVNERIARYYGVDVAAFEEEYRAYEYSLMDGSLDSSHFFTHINHLFKVDIPHNSLSTFFKPTVNNAVKELIISLRGKGHTVVSASNTYKDHYDIIRMMGVLDLFDLCFASHEMGVSKPSAHFFHQILEKTGFSPRMSIFIDDLIENIEGSRSVGIKSIHFVDEKEMPAIKKIEQLLDVRSRR